VQVSLNYHVSSIKSWLVVFKHKYTNIKLFIQKYTDINTQSICHINWDILNIKYGEMDDVVISFPSVFFNKIKPAVSDTQLSNKNMYKRSDPTRGVNCIK